MKNRYEDIGSDVRTGFVTVKIPLRRDPETRK
jgi:hypothetical protein